MDVCAGSPGKPIATPPYRSIAFSPHSPEGPASSPFVGEGRYSVGGIGFRTSNLLAKKRSLLGTPATPPKGKAAPPPMPRGKAMPPPLVRPVVPQAPPPPPLKQIFVSGSTVGWGWEKSLVPLVSEEEISRLFPPVSTNKTPTNSAPVVPVKSLRILDERKARNLEISFRHFRSPHNLFTLLDSADLSSLSAEDVSLLLREYPGEDLQARMERLELDRPDLEWEIPEQYLLALCTAGGGRSVLSAWYFALNYKISADSVNFIVNEVKTISDALTNSQGVIDLLAALLAVANRLNAGTHRGGLGALSIESLSQFEEHKSVENGTTALGFAVEVWKRHNPVSAMNFSAQISPLMKEKFAGSLQEAENELLKLSGESEAAACALDLLRERGADQIASEVEKGTFVVDSVVKKMKDAKTSWQRFVEFLGLRTEQARNSREIFELLAKFLRQVNKWLY